MSIIPIFSIKLTHHNHKLVSSSLPSHVSNSTEYTRLLPHTLLRIYYHDSNGTEVQLLTSGDNTTDWVKQSLPLKNTNMWRVKVVGKLSDEWYGGIGVDDIDITGCTG